MSLEASLKALSLKSSAHPHKEQSVPMLPVEILQPIVEEAAQMSMQTCRNLALTCSSFYEWFAFLDL